MPDSRWKLISICTLCEEGDMAQKLGELIDKISIHALREEGDSRRCRCCRSRPISIHALREEGDSSFLWTWKGACISIHALREEGDESGHPDQRHNCYFYPRPPRGGRQRWQCVSVDGFGFLSTPSARRATGEPLLEAELIEFLSTPSARRATTAYPTTCVCAGISIHALREEGDFPAWSNPKKLTAFLSTPSSRRATSMRWRQSWRRWKSRFLSTPSSRRATLCQNMERVVQGYFYPRPPHGGRPP